MESDSPYDISTDAARLDVDLIHGVLASSYWARGIPRDVVERSIRHSLCFGAFCGNRQVGFARVITDFATFAYLADVFVLPEHRRRGVAKLMMAAVMVHPELQGLRRFLLITRDAHRLYADFGFVSVPGSEQFMTVHRPDVYAHGGRAC